MKHTVIRQCMIVLLIGMVALSTVRAAAMENGSLWELEEFAGAVLSLSQAQTLRISVDNSPGQTVPGQTVTFTATIYAMNGHVIARSDEITLAPDELHSFNFNGAGLTLAAAPGTGRLQARIEIRRRRFSGLSSQLSQGDILGVVELVDNLTGKTQASTSLARGVYLASSSSQYKSLPRLLGLAHGQSLRVNLACLNEGARRGLLRARIRLHDAAGALIAQSDELVIPPDESRSYEIHRSALPLAGDPGNGRLQVAVTYLLKVDGVDGEGVSVSATLELVNNGGATSAVLNDKILICSNGTFCFPID
jgi:hypothetical protein